MPMMAIAITNSTRVNPVSRGLQKPSCGLTQGMLGITQSASLKVEVHLPVCTKVDKLES